MKRNVKSKPKQVVLNGKYNSVAPSKDYPWIVLGELVKDLVSVSSLRADDAHLVTQIIRDRDIHALRVLSEIWGLQCITSFDSLNVSEIRAKRMLAGLLKKYPFPSDADARRTLAVEKFIKAEAACAYFNHVGFRKLVANGDRMAIALTAARRFVKSVIGDRPRWEKLVPWCRFGPGATVQGNRISNSDFWKFAEWPYTVTEDALPYARFLIESDQRWFNALSESYLKRFGPKRLKYFWSDIFNIVDGNRIDFVPKDSTVDRSIAIEPLLNLRLQLGVDGFIRRQLKRFDIDLDSQLKNQVMASLGSELRQLSRFSTLDLASASDSVSLKLCELLLPEEWYSFLLKLRSPRGQLKGHGVIDYEKISSMGNGYTFVLESLIFAALITGAFQIEGIKLNYRKDIAVYGDDLIVPEKMYGTVVEILQNSGFTVNQDKSFHYGIVKESCGMDWFEGHLVRPVTLDRFPENVGDLFVDYNRLQRALNLYFGIPLGESATCQRIHSWIPPFFWKFMGPVSDEEFSTYLHTPDFRSHGKYKFGRWRYHRLSYRPMTMKVASYWSFKFRTLMHPLGTAPVKTRFDKVIDVGNRFAVTMKIDNVTVGQSYQPASDYWQEEYADFTTGAIFRASCAGVAPLMEVIWN